MKKDKKEKTVATPEEEVILEIPEDEIWTYKIDGLAAPRIGKSHKAEKKKKIFFVVVIFVAVMLSMYFSIRAVQRDTFEYSSLGDGAYEFTKFSNTGYITELDIDFVTAIEYIDGEENPEKNFRLKKQEDKPVTVIHEYAFNCDGNLETVNIGKDVTEIDGKAFYSCWNLEAIFVDEENEAYCDIDGVLYTKDKKTVVCYPINRDQYLRDRYGYKEELWPENEGFAEYREKVLTYVVPSTVETVGKLSFNYSNLVNVYLPEGLKTIETLGFFEMVSLQNIYSYKNAEVTGTELASIPENAEIYLSLPDGLESIGSDAFSFNQAMRYMFIPESVSYIGHHAFWETTYKQDGADMGISVMNIEADEESFKNVKCGNQWRPQRDNGAFRKTIDSVYGATRASLKYE